MISFPFHHWMLERDFERMIDLTNLVIKKFKDKYERKNNKKVIFSITQE